MARHQHFLIPAFLGVPGTPKRCPRFRSGHIDPYVDTNSYANTNRDADLHPHADGIADKHSNAHADINARNTTGVSAAFASLAA